MKNYEYYGLFLTEESKAMLKEWLISNGYSSELLRADKEYLDHCTLLHANQNNPLLERKLENAVQVLTDAPNIMNTFLVDGIGVSDKAMAFRCRIDKCANSIPHITVCTLNGGRPIDSNDILVWQDIEPIRVVAKLRKAYKEEVRLRMYDKYLNCCIALEIDPTPYSRFTEDIYYDVYGKFIEINDKQG